MEKYSKNTKNKIFKAKFFHSWKKTQKSMEKLKKYFYKCQ